MKEENTGLQPELTQEEQQEKRNEILQVRREKLDKLQQEGKDPFQITKFPVDQYAAAIKEAFAGIAPEEETGKTVCLGGRLMSKRVMGKASFADLRDASGDIQLYVRRDNVGKEPYSSGRWSCWCSAR